MNLKSQPEAMVRGLQPLSMRCEAGGRCREDLHILLSHRVLEVPQPSADQGVVLVCRLCSSGGIPPIGLEGAQETIPLGR